jgi:UDP-glucuronate decarboxylase
MVRNETSFNFEKLRNKSVLITGAGGLLGINLLKSLKSFQKSHNISITTWTKTDYEERDGLFSGCSQIVGDITDLRTFSDLGKYDYIIHSAGYAQPSKFLDDKIKTLEINGSCTIKLLDKLETGGSFLFISSSEVYNGLFKYAITEEEIGTTDPKHPRAAYIEGKRYGEVVCDVYREKGVDAKVARLSIVYGPGTRRNDTRAINSLIDKGLNDEVIEMLDDGSSIRTFCYITDAVEMIWNILLNGKSDVYNVGGVGAHSILHVAKIIGHFLEKKVRIPKHQNPAVGNPQLVNLSIGKYVSEFGSKDFVSLEDGLFETINWQKQTK